MTARNDYLHRRIHLIDTFKREAGCKACGIKDVKVLEFHHRDPATKVASIAKLRFHKKATLLNEIAKCDVYCANCHHILELEAGVYKSGSYIRKRREVLRRWLDTLKSESGCIRCGIKDARILKFHRNTHPSVSKMWQRGVGKEKLQKAVDESTIYCLNCRRVMLYE